MTYFIHYKSKSPSSYYRAWISDDSLLGLINQFKRHMGNLSIDYINNIEYIYQIYSEINKTEYIIPEEYIRFLILEGNKTRIVNEIGVKIDHLENIICKINQGKINTADEETKIIKSL